MHFSFYVYFLRNMFLCQSGGYASYPGRINGNFSVAHPPSDLRVSTGSVQENNKPSNGLSDEVPYTGAIHRAYERARGV